MSHANTPFTVAEDPGHLENVRYYHTCVHRFNHYFESTMQVKYYQDMQVIFHMLILLFFWADCYPF